MGLHKVHRGRNCLNVRVIAGLVIIAIGVLFFLRNMGMMGDVNLWRYWPVMLIIVGIVHIFSPRQYRRFWHGVLWVVIGTILLLKYHGIIPLTWMRMWPLILVLMGLGIVISTLTGHRPRAKPERGSTDLDTIDIHAVLGGGEYRITSQTFQGGRITAIMGGCELNLQKAGILPGEVEINVFAMWGGISLRVPEDWEVIVKGTPILGGFDNQANYLDDRAIIQEGDKKEKRRRLVVTGVAIMGGVEVKN